jgi:hypothetical protein
MLPQVLAQIEGQVAGMPEAQRPLAFHVITVLKERIGDS